MSGTGMEAKPARGTPEYYAFMRRIGAKGGRATHTRHPGHLAEIAHMGGHALLGTHRKKKPKPQAPVPEAAKVAIGAALASLDAILAEIENVG